MLVALIGLVDGNKTITGVDRMLFFSGFSLKSGGDKFRACLIVKADSAVKVSITNSTSGPDIEQASFSVTIKENEADRSTSLIGGAQKVHGFKM